MLFVVGGASSSCESRFRPNAIEKTFPPSMGESETYPQFSEKCAVRFYQHLIICKADGEGRTEAKPLDDERGEEAEEAAVREPEERARLPEVADAFDRVGGCL